MDTIIVLDGIKTELVAPDLDGDGRRGGIEQVTKHGDLEGNVSYIQQSGDIAQSLKILDDDSLDPSTNMSTIDLNAHLNQIEKNGFTVLDYLVSQGVLPIEVLQLSRQGKRLSVSVEGRGREQKVRMATGQLDRESRAGESFLDKAKGLFKKGEN